MAQTRTQRQASANEAAATRKQNAANRSASRTKASVRTTRSSAAATARSARRTGREAARTGRQATRTAGRRLDVVSDRIDELGRRAQRVLYIQVGVAATARDALVRNVQTYTRLNSVARELDQYERRGARALGRSERVLTRRRREIEHQTEGVRKDAENIVERVKRLA
ncbi:MAG: hypothetical protein JO168_10670 [Solirubrobacterales bacterium]|nr:hypothetical protein [Solirubrobacterales bacterium]